MLIVANKTRADIILKDEFEKMLGMSCINILSGEEKNGYGHGLISAYFLKVVINDLDQQYYICGPSGMVKSVLGALTSLGVNRKTITMEI